MKIPKNEQKHNTTSMPPAKLTLQSFFFVILFCPMISEMICLFMVSFFSLKKLHFHDIWYPSNLLDYDEKQKLKLQQFQLTFDSLRQAQSLGLVWKKSLFRILLGILRTKIVREFFVKSIEGFNIHFWIFREINCKCKVREKTNFTFFAKISWKHRIY